MTCLEVGMKVLIRETKSSRKQVAHTSATALKELFDENKEDF